MAEIYFFGVINYTFQPLNILLLQYTFLVNFPSIYPVLSGKSADPPPPLLVENSTIYFFETFSKENIVSWTQVAIRLNKISPKQAQESLAAAMSLNSIVTSWADDCIETTDFKLLQPSTGNKQHVKCNLYHLTFAFKGKP